MFAFLKPKAKTRRIAACDAIAQAKSGALTLIDVREADELRQTGKAKGAVHIPLAQIAAQSDPKSGHFNRKLSAEKPVALYCASGMRSERAAHMLAANGYAEVYNLGSLQDWQNAGGAIVR